jgi:hypothetical protein
MRAAHVPFGILAGFFIAVDLRSELAPTFTSGIEGQIGEAIGAKYETEELNW